MRSLLRKVRDVRDLTLKSISRREVCDHHLDRIQHGHYSREWVRRGERGEREWGREEGGREDKARRGEGWKGEAWF